MKRPIHVLHVLDWLGQGGSEQLLWELVRRSNPERVVHRIVTVFPYEPSYVFADRLHRLGAYDLPAAATTAALNAPSGSGAARATDRGGGILRSLHRMSAPLLHGMPDRWKRPVWDLEEVAGALPTLLAECWRNPPDVIHSHVFAGFRAGLALHYLTAKPYVHTITGMFAQLRRIGHERIISHFRQFRRSVARWFIAHEYRSDLLGIGVEEERIGGLRGVIDTAAIAGVRADLERHRREIRRSLGLPEDALLALSVGRFDPSKGHEHAIDALARVVDALPRLHWIALGQGRPLSEYEQRARSLGVAGHAHVLGFRDDPLPYYAAADIYLRTPVIEAENLSSYNAMAMGIPVVGFDTGGPTELIPTVGHGILVRNGDSSALAQGIIDVLSSPDRGRSIGARGIAYADRHLDITRSIDEFVTGYERVLTSSGGT